MTLPPTYAQFIEPCPTEDVPLLRELLADDVLLPCSTDLVREPNGNLTFRVAPGPLHWSRQSEWVWVLRYGDFTKDQRVLEVAGGHSVLKFALARRVSQVIDTEFEGWYMPNVQATIDQLGYTNITLVRADARALPWPDAWFERVVCVSTLEHIEEGCEKALDEMLRVLKPGGVLLLTVDVKLSGEGPGDFFLTPGGCADLARRLGIQSTLNEMKGISQLGDMVSTVMLFRYAKPEKSE